MPSLSELTDYDPSPVQQPYAGPRLVVTPSNVNPDTDQLPVDTRPEPRPEPLPALGEFNTTVGTKVDNILNKLTGSNGEERYQLWPEKVVRSGLGAAGDVLSGNVSQWAVDNDTGDVHTSPQMIEKAQEISALAGTGGLAGTTDATLGAGPFLRPALKYEGKIYKAPIKDAKNPLGFGAEHSDALPTHLADDFYKKAMSGEDINHYQFGFMNEKGQFLDREKALNHGINTGLVDPQNGKYGVLTSTMLADSSKPGTAIEAMAKAEPFYSAVEHNVNAIPQSKMNGDQWLATLSNKPGVKSEELQWTGLKDFLEENKGKPVTKEQVQEHLQNNKVELKEVDKGGDAKRLENLREIENSRQLTDAEKKEYLSLENNSATKYHSYQLPGGSNYREKLLTLPPTQNNLNQFKVINEHGHVESTWIDKAKADAWAAKNNYTVREDKPIILNGGYKSSHWDEPNILAHVRMNDRTIDGKKSLHLEEIQSDWHQQGRDKGYKVFPDELKKSEKIMSVKDADPLFRAGLKQNGFDLDKIANEKLYIYDHNGVGGYSLKEPANKDTLSGWIEDGHKGTGVVPDAPFKKTWHELALKRMIREAAEKGYDRLSWTPGEAQAARYDLSKTFNNIRAFKNEDGTFKVWGRPEGGQVHDFGNKIPVDKLPDFVGKELAEKIAKQETQYEKVYSGLDLKVGGEGMKGFYDQIIPKSLEKISGQKVKQGSIPSDNIRKTVDDRYTVVGDKRIFDTKAEAEKVANSPVHYIDIPQELKEKAMSKGFPLFSNGYMFTPVSGDPFKSDKK